MLFNLLTATEVYIRLIGLFTFIVVLSTWKSLTPKDVTVV
jgi:hypothetical protein